MTKDEMISQLWFAEMINDVHHFLDQCTDQKTCAAATKEEVALAESQMNGWLQSLSNPDLDQTTRRLIESQMQATSDRINTLKMTMAEKEAQADRRDSLVDPKAIAERLNNLARVLADHNPSMINIELSQHIDRIDCHADGRAVLRTCRLGVLGEAMDVFSVDEPCVPHNSSDAGSTKQAQPRRRARRRIAGVDQPTEKIKALAEWSTDPHRFAGLDERWFDEYEFHITAFDQQIELLKAELAEAVIELDNHYDELRSAARERLGDLFDPSDYPPSLLDAFQIEHDYPSVEPPDYLRQLNPEVYEQEVKRVQARFDEALQLAEKAFVDELSQLVSHLTERLSGHDDGRSKVFRDTAVENLHQFFQRFQLLNVRSNEQLDALVNQCRQIVDGVQPLALRNDSSLRQQVSSQLSGVQSILDGLLVDRPRRRIIRTSRSDR
ncbi:hypothetical protein [Rubinisphaera margarita]|uniref:hypothetical protein n=1 Tax=Rubinisphaera margarita TaxID=2909586 RepID=UPI001EE88D2E|nr:hypothetical protein [Rubinisphaera margarita]MCG6157707.1 hypothetical protein [Rubinisphaera margarita]